MLKEDVGLELKLSRARLAVWPSKIYFGDGSDFHPLLASFTDWQKKSSVSILTPHLRQHYGFTIEAQERSSEGLGCSEEIEIFDPPATAELVRTDGVNGDSKILDKDVASPDAVEYDQYVKEESQKFSQSVAAEDSTSLNGGTALKEANRKAGQARILGSKRVKALKKRSIDPWKLSESIGGRMVNAEPVFADDEKCVALLSMECC